MLGWFNIDREFQALEDFRRRMEMAIDEMGRESHDGGSRPTSWPRGNLFDAGSHLVLEVGVPGVEQDDLKLTGNQDVLTISGERKAHTPEGYAVHRRERNNISFCRSFRFPMKVDMEKTEANLKDGILTVKIPKAPEVQPRSITVNVNN